MSTASPLMQFPPVFSPTASISAVPGHQTTLPPQNISMRISSLSKTYLDKLARQLGIKQPNKQRKEDVLARVIERAMKDEQSKTLSVALIDKFENDSKRKKQSTNTCEDEETFVANKIEELRSKFPHLSDADLEANAKESYAHEVASSKTKKSIENFVQRNKMLKRDLKDVQKKKVKRAKKHKRACLWTKSFKTKCQRDNFRKQAKILLMTFVERTYAKKKEKELPFLYFELTNKTMPRTNKNKILRTHFQEKFVHEVMRHANSDEEEDDEEEESDNECDSGSDEGSDESGSDESGSDEGSESDDSGNGSEESESDDDSDESGSDDGSDDSGSEDSYSSDN